jgi:hypothetical protein
MTRTALSYTYIMHISRGFDQDSASGPVAAHPTRSTGISSIRCSKQSVLSSSRRLTATFMGGLIEDTLRLPPFSRLQKNAHSEQLYYDVHEVAQDIARMMNLGRSVVPASKDRFSHPQRGDSQKRPSQLPLDCNDRDRRGVRFEIERVVICHFPRVAMKQYTAGGARLKKASIS